MFLAFFLKGESGLLRSVMLVYNLETLLADDSTVKI